MCSNILRKYSRILFYKSLEKIGLNICWNRDFQNKAESHRVRVFNDSFTSNFNESQSSISEESEIESSESDSKTNSSGEKNKKLY